MNNDGAEVKAGRLMLASLETPTLTKAELAEMLFDKLGLNKRESKDINAKSVHLRNGVHSKVTLFQSQASSCPTGLSLMTPLHRLTPLSKIQF